MQTSAQNYVASVKLDDDDEIEPVLEESLFFPLDEISSDHEFCMADQYPTTTYYSCVVDLCLDNSHNAQNINLDPSLGTGETSVIECNVIDYGSSCESSLSLPSPVSEISDLGDKNECSSASRKTLTPSIIDTGVSTTFSGSGTCAPRSKARGSVSCSSKRLKRNHSSNNIQIAKDPKKSRHNDTEKKYRSRLNDQFERLLGILLEDGGSECISLKDEDICRPSKARILNMAYNRIRCLQDQHNAVLAKRDVLHDGLFSWIEKEMFPL